MGIPECVATDHQTVEAHMGGISYDTSFAHTLGCTARNCTVPSWQCRLYTVHCLMTLLLNYINQVKLELM